MGSPLLVREDWTDFRSLETLTRRAGVATDTLHRLVAKELVDNALDAGNTYRYGLHGDNGFYVEDDGPGIDGADQDLAELFSIRRPLTSSKMLRLPTRGALGNGLRVVVGTILCSGGKLRLGTRGRTLTLVPQDDGTTRVDRKVPYRGSGTRIEVRFGPDLLASSDLFDWAERAVMLAHRGKEYEGRSSPHWYTPDAFWELLQASQGATVRQFISGLEGCGGNAASRIAENFRSKPANQQSREEAARLLQQAQRVSRPVRPKRLGQVGRLDEFDAYCIQRGTLSLTPRRGGQAIVLPYVVEAWAAEDLEPSLQVCVNRTPITAQISIQRLKDKTSYFLHGCELIHSFKAPRALEFEFLLNIQIPWIQQTTESKQPILRPLRDAILSTLHSVAQRASRALRSPADTRPASRKEVIRQHLDSAIAKASGEGQYRYSLRQLYYVLRPSLLEAFPQEPDYDRFARVITELEAERGHDLPGLYRDTRGSLYHPHRREWLNVGTLSIEQYRRPEWTFNKILYCEKEGLFPALVDVQWPERYDCALLTSKGFATRAARDILDFLGESGEPLAFFCIHDADGPGTLIYQALVKATQARGGRTVQIINLGLDVPEARRLGLPVERVSRADGKRVPVADYVRPQDADWLQTHRVELNAMTTEMFLRWLERKIAQYHRKLVPPMPVLRERLQRDVQELARAAIVERVLREAKVDKLTQQAIAELRADLRRLTRRLLPHVTKELKQTPKQAWSEAVRQAARQLVASAQPN